MPLEHAHGLVSGENERLARLEERVEQLTKRVVDLHDFIDDSSNMIRREIIEAMDARIKLIRAELLAEIRVKEVINALVRRGFFTVAGVIILGFIGWLVSFVMSRPPGAPLNLPK